MAQKIYLNEPIKNNKSSFVCTESELSQLRGDIIDRYVLYVIPSNPNPVLKYAVNFNISYMQDDLYNVEVLFDKSRSVSKYAVKFFLSQDRINAWIEDKVAEWSERLDFLTLYVSLDGYGVCESITNELIDCFMFEKNDLENINIIAHQNANRHSMIECSDCSYNSISVYIDNGVPCLRVKIGSDIENFLLV